MKAILAQYELTYPYYRGSNSASGRLRTDLYHFRKIVAWHQEEATKEVDAKNGDYRSAYFSD